VLAGRSLTLSDTLLLNTPVGKVLLRLQQCQDTIVEIRAHRHPSKRQPFEFTDQELACLSIDGCNLSDLSLDFTVPGFSDVRLPESNSDTDVVFSNLSTYIDSVGSFFTVNACREPVAALRRGMTRGMGDTAALLALSESESESILCGDHDRAWDLSVPTLVRHARCQGFENSDRIVMALFECIAKFTPVQQRQFIRFVTGSPRLPLGGLKNLNPGSCE
jgi:E3 ubiquitin-protein ligase TRIP12